MDYQEVDDFANPYRAPNARIEEVPVPAGFVSGTRGIDLAVENPWLTIWTRPRATIRGIVDYDPAYRMLFIAMLAAMIQGFASALPTVMQSTQTIAFRIGTMFGAGILLFVIYLLSIWGGGWLYGVVGRWVGGQARTPEARAAVAWALVPGMVSSPIYALVLVASGIGSEAGRQLTPSQLIAFGAAFLLQIVSGFWSAMIMFKGLGEVHGFSAWKAFGVTILGNLLIFLVCAVIALIVAALMVALMRT